MLGVITCSALVYSSGVFLGAMTGEFGWTRARFASAFAIQMLAELVSGPLPLTLLVFRAPPLLGRGPGCRAS